MTGIARPMEGFGVEPYAVYGPSQTIPFDWLEKAAAGTRCGVPFLERVDFDDFVGYAAYHYQALKKGFRLRRR